MQKIHMRCPVLVDIVFDVAEDAIEKVTLTQPGLSKYEAIDSPPPTPRQLLKIADWAWEDFAFETDESDCSLFHVAGRDIKTGLKVELFVSSSEATIAEAKAAVVYAIQHSSQLVDAKATLRTNSDA
ncbi:MAG: hypothetical protein JHD02_00255 [Thermoleophilaceae bacterium]|nr:hypothetical protein [Thermoleophilaceae bacterium]